MNVKTNIGRKFLQLVKTTFNKEHCLQKIFNKNTLNISYCCMKNLQQIISANNQKAQTRDDNIQTRLCNCRQPTECPLDNKCLSSSIIYQCTVESNEEKEHYVGLTANSFKKRYSSHKHSFNNDNCKLATELSKYIWQLKSKNVPYTLSWRILSEARPYSNMFKKCNLCILEKFYILFRPELATLNKRSELFSSCRHRNKYLLKYVDIT